jgi:hypothetical protein
MRKLSADRHVGTFAGPTEALVPGLPTVPPASKLLVDLGRPVDAAVAAADDALTEVLLLATPSLLATGLLAAEVAVAVAGTG